MSPKMSNAPVKKSSDDAPTARLATPSPAAGVRHRTDAEDHPRVMDYVRKGQLAIQRERFAFLVGMVIRQIVVEPFGAAVVPNGGGDIEEARGAEEEGIVVDGGRDELMEEDPTPQRGQKRRSEDSEEDKEFMKPAKIMKVPRHVRFSDEVRMRLFNRDPDEPPMDSVELLNDEEICEDAEDVEMEDESDGEANMAICEDVEMADEDLDDGSDGPANMAICEDMDVSDGEDVSDESDGVADIAMVEDFESPTVSPTFDGFSNLDWSSPSLSNQQSDVTMQLEENSTMRLSDSNGGDDDDGSSSPDDSSHGWRSSSSSDDDEDNTPQIDLAPHNFSRDLLNLFPLMVDQSEVDFCNDGEELGAVGMFVGLLKVATTINRSDSDRQVAVLHPELFKLALKLEEEERAGKKPVREICPHVLQNNSVYGSGWTDLLIPMLVNGNHWVVAVVRRSLVSITIYDSLAQPLCQDLALAALRKIIRSLKELNPEDRTTSRFSLRYARPGCSDVQQGGTDCGLFAVSHARRALHRTTRSAAQRSGDEPIDVRAERREIRAELIRLMEHFEAERNAGRRWRHAPGGGHSRFHPTKTPVALRYSGRGV